MRLQQPLSRARRALKKPPRVLARRIADEITVELERVLAPRRAARLDIGAVLGGLGDRSLEDAWGRLAARPYLARIDPLDPVAVEQLCPGEVDRVLAAAAAVLERRVDLLGSGPVELPRPVDWLVDFKTGRRWEPAFHRSIDYANLDEASDVKVPWELSRLQWALPAGQAYLLTAEERYAEAVRDLLDEWIRANPYAQTVNWSTTMEVALRILTWTWFFHVFNASRAWSDPGFRARFLTSVVLHGDFTERNLERSDVNGNHFTADAAGLVVAGLFLGAGSQAQRWARDGWAMLESELPRQVFPDGVDFEASTAYHRLVLELFLLPALYRRRLGQPVPDAYRERLEAMAGFAAAYTRPDGSTPAWGDADDGRALPLGHQPIGDHRYLPALVGSEWGSDELAAAFRGPHSELLWLLGPERAATSGPAVRRRSRGFPHGGVYVLAGDDDHVFVDAGPIGLAGRGGHGHNDCLALEAWLAGEPVLTDAGAYVYTASPEWRNRFRGTTFHSTPEIDGEEQNRFVRPDWLWSLHDDTRPEVRLWEPDVPRLVAAHFGYARLAEPVTTVRAVELDPRSHRLLVEDRFEGTGEHIVSVPYHVAPGIEPRPDSAGRLRLVSPRRTFVLTYADPAEWRLAVGESWTSPSYGVKLPRSVILFHRHGSLRPLRVTIESVLR